MMAVRFLKIAALYLVAGMTLGAYMGATENFALAPVHAHVNLLGFMIPTLVGLIGLVRPAVLETRLATVFSGFVKSSYRYRCLPSRGY